MKNILRSRITLKALYKRNRAGVIPHLAEIKKDSCPRVNYGSARNEAEKSVPSF
jgi:hypothetical protein